MSADRRDLPTSSARDDPLAFAAMTSGDVGETCDRCGWTMVVRRNSSTGEPFLGCSQFPACRGTRPLRSGAVADRRPNRARSARVRLSTGGRYARDFPDVMELLVARLVGRTLSRSEGCLVQVLALLGLLAIVYLFVASGAFMWIVTWVSEWLAGQFKFQIGGSPTPSP